MTATAAGVTSSRTLGAEGSETFSYRAVSAYNAPRLLSVFFPTKFMLTLGSRHSDLCKKHSKRRGLGIRYFASKYRRNWKGNNFVFAGFGYLIV